MAGDSIPKLTPADDNATRSKASPVQATTGKTCCYSMRITTSSMGRRHLDFSSKPNQAPLPVSNCSPEHFSPNEATPCRQDIVLRSGLLCLKGFVLAWTTVVAIADETASPTQSNRLRDETSSYLLQHASNPVDWYPWNQEALDRAKRENKPIFLSIGYSSCHWCHVMEHESFTDMEIAKFLNENFICIKVDREERPDVDAIYMTAVQIITRRGGWPLSVFLTSDAKPFFGGTYFPARTGDRGRAVGFLTILKKIQQTWSAQADAVKKNADELTRHIQRAMGTKLPGKPLKISSDLLQQALGELDSQFDPEHGGFGYQVDNPTVPKFPQGSTLLFLLELAEDTGNAKAEEMVEITLDHIAWGGLRDHLGGGFHRYSVDRFWNIPHFEKMLYDNAQLLTAYSRAYPLTKNDEYRQVIEEIVAFLDRDMSSPQGGFYSAIDADSEGKEGIFYVWKANEWSQVLDQPQSELFANVYTNKTGANFESEFFQPLRKESWASSAKRLSLATQDLRDQLSLIRDKLLEYRDKRTPPFTDTKILTAWNGLMIRGLADAGIHLHDIEITKRAIRCADFLLNNVTDKQGYLYRTFSDGRPRLAGYLDDYAFFIDGLIALHDATQNQRWLDEAMKLQEIQNHLFTDSQQGGFFFTAENQQALLVRSKLFNEGARPSGAAVSATNLIALGKRGNRPDYLDLAAATLRTATSMLARAPGSVPTMATAVSRYLNTPRNSQTEVSAP